jgi:hypothetical protein
MHFQYACLFVIIHLKPLFIREHHHNSSTSNGQHTIPRDSIILLENHFEIGDLDDNLETTSSTSPENDSQRYTQHNTTNNLRQRDDTQQTYNAAELGETLQRLYGLNFSEGWDIGTSAEEMKHQILLGLRVGFCGAVSTWSSWNSAMISLLQRGKIGEALVGYALGIQLGVVCYRCKYFTAH